MTGPLADLKVVELTQMVAGSMVGMHLSDYGAEVVKIERPTTGELARNVEPFAGGESFYYLSVNRGKQSVTIDLKSEAGREIFYDLVEDADVVIENYTPGTVDRLGVGYDAVVERNPAIIYCSVSAYGQTGPKRNQSGIDTMLQAFAGVSALTRDTNGHPLRCSLPVADLAGAMYALMAILSVVHERKRTGQGDYLDVALGDSLLSFLGVRASYAFATGAPFPSIARHHVYFVPEGIFETADGYLQVSAVTQAHWELLCEALNRPDLAAEPAYATIDARREHRDELVERLNRVFSDEPTAVWLDRLAEYDVPSERINDICTVWDDEHTVAREMLTHVVTPEGVDFPSIAPPVKHRRATPDASEYIAALGADTEGVLRDVGYTDAEIDRFAADGVI